HRYERAEALESDLEADRRHRHLRSLEELARSAHTPLDHILMRSTLEDRFERANQMELRQLRRFRDVVQTNGLDKSAVDFVFDVDDWTNARRRLARGGRAIQAGVERGPVHALASVHRDQCRGGVCGRNCRY